MCNSYSPDSSEKYATDLPSGDQAGSRSAVPGEFVRLRVSPFSAGTVRISPRASNSARLPDGDSPAFRTFFATFSIFGRTAVKSAVTRTGTGRDFSVFRSEERRVGKE